MKNVLGFAVIIQFQNQIKKHIEAAADLINAAKKPFIVFGQGVILGQAEERIKSVG